MTLPKDLDAAVVTIVQGLQKIGFIQPTAELEAGLAVHRVIKHSLRTDVSKQLNAASALWSELG